jgi:MFS family permease
MSTQTTRLRPLKEGTKSDAAWLTELCLSRVGFVFIFTAYSAALPLLKTDWNMSASEAGLVQSAWHTGYLISLFAVGFVADRYGAKKCFLPAVSLPAPVHSCLRFAPTAFFPG